jgi:hypothetical protein
VLVRIAIDASDARILPDLGVKVTFLRDADDKTAPTAQPTILVPKAAVRTEQDKSFVFVVHGDAVERRAVSLGGTDGDRMEVTAGLRSGDRVVLTPPPTLADGMKVIVK